MALKQANRLNFGFGGVDQSELSLSYMYGMPNYCGGGSPNSSGFDNPNQNQIDGCSKGGRKGGRKGGGGSFISLEHLGFNKDVFLGLLSTTLQKKNYKNGIRVTKMHGVYKKHLSKELTKGKKTMFTLKNLLDKFSTRGNKYAKWVEESITIVTKPGRGEQGETIIKMKKR